MLFQALTFKLPKKLTDLEAVFFYLGCILLFLGCSDILSFQGHLVLGGSVLLFLSVICSGRFYHGWLLWACLLFGGFYLLGLYLSGAFNLSSVFYNFALPPILLNVTLRISSLESVKARRFRVLFLLLSVLLGLFVAFCFYAVGTIKAYGLYFPGGFVSNYWSGGRVNRTGVSLYCVGSVGLASYVIFAKNPFRKWYTIVTAIIVIVGTSVFSFVAGNRSFLAFVALLAGFWVIVGMFRIKKQALKAGLIAVAIAVFLFMSLLYLGLIPLPSFLAKIPVISRIISGGSNEERLLLYRQFFSTFFKHPLGGTNHEMTRQYVHNLWLDFYTYGGIVAFALVTLMLVFFFWMVWDNRKMGWLRENTSLLFATIVISYLCLGLFEPIYQANYLCFSPVLIVFFYMAGSWSRRSIRNNRYKIG